MKDKRLVPDPLAAFVVGKLSQETSLRTTELCLPARDIQGGPILISGQLVQFGQAEVKYIHKEEEKDLEIHTKIVAITAWRDEMNSRAMGIDRSISFSKTYKV